MKRTVVRHSLTLNNNKFADVEKTVNAFTAQKDDFLVQYAHITYMNKLKTIIFETILSRMNLSADTV